MRRKQDVVVLILGVVLVGATAGTASTLAVSPGAVDRIAVISDECPTFSWAATEAASAYELVVFEVGQAGAPPGAEAMPVLRQRLAGGALSWTPSVESCLAAGKRYAWMVRTVGAEYETAWSEARFFEVEARVSVTEVKQALVVLQSFLAAKGASAALLSNADDGPRPELPVLEETLRREGGVGPELSLSSATVGIWAERWETTGETVGAVGVSHSAQGAGLAASNTAGGADLLIDGSADGETDLLLSQSGIDRASSSVETFEIGNSGSGSMTLMIDGSEALTVATHEETEYSAGNQLNLTDHTFDVIEGPGSGLDADTIDGLEATGFAGSSHSHSGSDITTGTVAEPRIHSAIARDNEVMPTVLANDGTGSTLDADLLDGQQASAFAGSIHNHSGADITSGTVAEPRIHSAIARDNEVMPIVLGSDGPGSALNADYVDNLHASAFMPASADSWVNTTGDAMSGALEVHTSDVTSGEFTSSNPSYETNVISAEFTASGNLDGNAVYGKSIPAPYYGFGGYFEGGWVGVRSYATEPGTGSRYGVNSSAGGGDGSIYGVRGSASGGSTTYGVFGYGSGGSTNDYGVYAAGNLAYTGTLIHISDGSLKEELVPIDHALAKLLRLEVKSFGFRQDPELESLNLPRVRQYGFVAQEVAEVLPELVVDVDHPLPEDEKDKEGTGGTLRLKGLKPMELIPLLVRAIQEQEERIRALESQVSVRP